MISTLSLMMCQLLTWYLDQNSQKLLKINRLPSNKQKEQSLLLKKLFRKKNKLSSEQLEKQELQNILEKQ